VSVAINAFPILLQVALEDGAGQIGVDLLSAKANTAASRPTRASQQRPSSGPLEIDRPWDACADDHLDLMDHLGIDKLKVMGLLDWRPLRRGGLHEADETLPQPICADCVI
jgi:hypothetical protein